MIRLLPRPTLPAPGDQAVIAALTRPQIPALHIDRLPQGIDGKHIDVALGPSLDKAARIYVGALLQERLARLWNESSTASSDQFAEHFKEQVRQHHETAVRLAHDSGAIEHIQLFQLSLVKLVLQQIDGELLRIREGLEDERFQRERQMSGKGLQLHRQASLLSRNAAHLRYWSIRLVFREINRLEQSGMRNLRKSVLGRSWPVAEVMLNNPLLMLHGIGSLRDFVEHYPIVLHQLPRTRALLTALLSALGDWLPEGVDAGHLQTATQPNKRGDVTQRLESSELPSVDRWARSLISDSERRQAARTWFDDPDSVAALLGGVASDWPAAGPWAPRDLSNLQRQLNAKFGRAVWRIGLQRHIKAAYTLAAVYPKLGIIGGETPVFDYLAGDIDRPELTQRLGVATPGVDATQLIRRIDDRVKAYRRAGTGRRPQLARLAYDLCRLRRDLKLAGPMLAGLARIRLVDDPEALELSRENNCLQIFCQQMQLPDARGSLIGHAIIRVDLRGANALVATIARRGLSPAAYFSRFLYDPLTALLERFFAQKVMIEAGTLVLSTLQHSGQGSMQLAVARGCALAEGVIGQVVSMNGESERLGLPPLETSVAVVYADAPPTYLYDQSRRVLVSPANTRARRMSSCHVLMRRRCALPVGQRLCVATPLPTEERPAAKDEVVRYNVNGIELDEAAFVQLHAELSMRKVRLRIAKSRRALVLFVGQCPDSEGKMHRLIVREDLMKLWMGPQLIDSPDEGRSYYELVVDPTLTRLVSERIEAKESASTPNATANTGAGNP